MSVLDIKEQTMIVHGEPVTITNDTIKKTCRWYADNALDCIEEMKEGSARVNDPDGYKAWRMEEHNNFKTGNFKAGPWFWQRAYYIQTGEDIPILQ